MTKLPNIYSMEVQEWFEQMSKIAETVEAAIVDTLNTYTHAHVAWEVLNAALEPYVIDASDETIVQLTTKVDGDVLYIGLIGNWFELTYLDAGFWWFKDEEPGLNNKGEVGTPEERHEYLAHCIMDNIEWTDDQLSNRESWHQERRQIGEAYLHAIEPLVANSTSKASDYRPHLSKLAMALCTQDKSFMLRDISPDDHHTHLTILKNNTILGRILAVAPNSTITFNQLLEKLNLDANDKTIISITNHLYFEWGPNVYRDEIMVKLPATKNDDVETYFHSLEWLVTRLSGLVSWLDDKNDHPF